MILRRIWLFCQWLGINMTPGSTALPFFWISNPIVSFDMPSFPVRWLGCPKRPPYTAPQIRTDAFEIHLEETGMTLLIQAPDFEKELVRVHVSSPVTLLDECNGTLKQVQETFLLERH